MAKKKISKQKDSTKKTSNHKSINYFKILTLLSLVIGGGFSGVYFEKFNLKEQIVNFRHYIYNYFNSSDKVNKQSITTNNESIFARFFSQSDEAKKQQENKFDNLKQYPPVKNLPEITDYCHGFLAYGNPSYGITDGLGQANIYLCRDGYVVGYNYKTKEASWVAFRLTKAKVANHFKRENKFKEDYDIPFVYRATLNDYANSGYDRGHLASYASMDFSKKSAEQSFLLSNIAPQKAGLNQQGWERLETYERIWANMYDSIYVFTGPIYKKQKIHKTIGDNKIAVPDYFFKIIYIPSKNKAIAFVMPNKQVNKNKVANYRVSIKDIEQRTGLHFLTNIPNRDDIIDNVSPMWRTSYL
ncbi:MAG: DNA/RNA non-specific endonuclease [Francisella sp.]